jgi:hypothetical protein
MTLQLISSDNSSHCRLCEWFHYTNAAPSAIQLENNACRFFWAYLFTNIYILLFSWNVGLT